LNKFIDDIVQRFAVLDRDDLPAETPTIPPLTTFLIFKTAAVITRRLQDEIEPEVNLQRLIALRRTLKIIARRWLAGGKNTF
jgi:hypothetical protein